MRKEDRLIKHIQDLQNHIRDCYNKISANIQVSYYLGKSIDNRDAWTLNDLRTQVKMATTLNHRTYLEVNHDGDLKVKTCPNLPTIPDDLMENIP